jgi:hypothetical protein
MRHFLLLLLVATALAWIGGCTTVEPLQRGKDSAREYLIACGAASGWNVCYRQANATCPKGYVTLSETPGFNRKEMKIRCDRS